MKTLLTIIVCFYYSTLFAQTKRFSNVTYSDGDTTIWYHITQNLVKDLSLIRIDTSSSTYYFRLWNTTQVLEIWKNIDSSFSGQLTTWVRELTPANEKPTGRIQISKRILQVDTVKLMHNLIEESQMVYLPTEDSIKGWRQGFDGITYKTEFASKTSYDFKTYWTPKAQDSTLQVAKLVQSFVDTLFQSCNANAIWKEFRKSIPFESYRYGITNVSKVVTKKERRRFAAERKNYRQQKYLQ
ncbi:hypothetical protein [Limnovirga soli]|uniref:Uncharacterized protein n=1 Tax=Limnovirga soli TaxID=2656915 RepID=A0A8J8FAD9_9BACT|nr:hypothetical protein [Limnovirga soli]NNV54115.1 hypothetical protein [Limnovirga soli]